MGVNHIVKSRYEDYAGPYGKLNGVNMKQPRFAGCFGQG